jgi:hypothetical protein
VLCHLGVSSTLHGSRGAEHAGPCADTDPDPDADVDADDHADADTHTDPDANADAADCRREL